MFTRSMEVDAIVDGWCTDVVPDKDGREGYSDLFVPLGAKELRLSVKSLLPGNALLRIDVKFPGGDNTLGRNEVLKPQETGEYWFSLEKQPEGLYLVLNGEVPHILFIAIRVAEELGIETLDPGTRVPEEFLASSK